MHIIQKESTDLGNQPHCIAFTVRQVRKQQQVQLDIIGTMQRGYKKGGTHGFTAAAGKESAQHKGSKWGQADPSIPSQIKWESEESHEIYM